MDEYVKRQLSSVPGHIGFYTKMVDYLKKALIYGHTSRISN